MVRDGGKAELVPAIDDDGDAVGVALLRLDEALAALVDERGGLLAPDRVEVLPGVG